MSAELYKELSFQNDFIRYFYKILFYTMLLDLIPSSILLKSNLPNSIILLTCRPSFKLILYEEMNSYY